MLAADRQRRQGRRSREAPVDSRPSMAWAGRSPAGPSRTVWRTRGGPSLCAHAHLPSSRICQPTASGAATSSAGLLLRLSRCAVNRGAVLRCREQLREGFRGLESMEQVRAHLRSPQAGRTRRRTQRAAPTTLRPPLTDGNTRHRQMLCTAVAATRRAKTAPGWPACTAPDNLFRAAGRSRDARSGWRVLSPAPGATSHPLRNLRN